MEDAINTFLMQGLPAVCGGLIVHFWDKAKGLNSRLEKMVRANRIMMKIELRRIHAYAIEKGCITYDDQAIAEAIYQTYHDLGGNGQGTQLIEALRQLPVKKIP